MDDKQIIQALFARAEGAIEALARRFGSRLYRIAQNILRSDQDAEECVSDTYLALWNAIPPAEPEPLPPYVYRTGRNIALKRYRANTAEKRNSAYDLSLDELCEYLPDIRAEAEAESRAIGRAMDCFLSTETRDNRVIFLRRYWFGDSVKAIAKAMGRIENSVSVSLNRTRNKLKKYLVKEGFYYEA
ncbi:MAG: sigma-70 family RNA polymerase sigma factor [Clostridia bacterium]|nr:sigma-70 family RNA polymerase sigma factor [Clostridia bacterium]